MCSVDWHPDDYLGRTGQRIVEGQRLIQATSDVFLGWAQLQAEDGKEFCPF